MCFRSSWCRVSPHALLGIPTHISFARPRIQKTYACNSLRFNHLNIFAGCGTEIETLKADPPNHLSNFLSEDTMFDLSDPRSWTYFTNWILVAVALVAAGYIGFGLLREKRARRLHARPHSDPHTLILPDLGITMADGGEKVASSESKNKKTPA
jgi:hypothetical protein